MEEGAAKLGSVEEVVASGTWTQWDSLPEGPEMVRRSLSEKAMRVTVVRRVLLMMVEADLVAAGKAAGCVVGGIAVGYTYHLTVSVQDSKTKEQPYPCKQMWGGKEGPARKTPLPVDLLEL